MFPLPLLPTSSENLVEMKARRALLYQNSFMKNALIRALNVLYEVAPKIDASHPALRQFMEYAEMVCDMIDLHIRGDEVFFNSLSQQSSTFRFTSNKGTIILQNQISTLRSQIHDWKKDPNSYRPSHLQKCLGSMEISITEVFHKQIPKFAPDALPQSIPDDKLKDLIQENMIWLGTNSDITILVPFCISHHDLKTSKYWPPVTDDGVKALPEVVLAHPHLWKFAPFDAVTRSSKGNLLDL